MEQTVYLGSGSTSDIIVYVQAISSAGSHVALVVDTSTTKLVFASGSQSSVVPSVTSLGTGKAKITFASVTNSGNLAAGDSVAVKVNGTADGVAFSEYLIPVFIDSAGGGGGGGLTEADVRNAVGLASANLDTQLSTIDSVVDAVLIDTGTDIPASIAALNNFDPASDTVANVSAVGSITNPVTTDSASRTASQADVSSLATAASIAALNDFDPASDTVANVTNTANVTNAVTTDTASRDASKADVSGLATSSSIAALNDFDPATDTVANVTNTANVTNAVETDAASRNASKADVSSLATSAEITALNNVSAADVYTYFTDGVREQAFHADVSGVPADVWSYSTRTITSGGITPAEVASAVWDATLNSYNSAGTTGKALRQLKEGVISKDAEVSDSSATASTFVTNLTESVDDYYHDKVMVFISGNLIGQARHIESYNGTTKAITTSQPFTSAPNNASEFLILAVHESSPNEISDAVWDELQSTHTTVGSFGYYLDSQVSQAGAGGTGLYQLTVNIQDQNGAALSGARVNIDGTVLTLTSDSSGQCVFNLDSGVYLINVSPPGSFQTPTGQTATIATADIAKTFTLEPSTSQDGDIPWIG